MTVYSSGPSGGDAPGLEAVLLKFTNAADILEVYGGSVGVAVLAGETANISGGLIVGGGSVRVGSGATLAVVTLYDGNLETNSLATTVTVLGGVANLKSGNVTTLTLEGGTTFYQGVGTIATLNGYSGATLDCTRDGSGRTVTNGTVYAGFTLKDPGKTITFSNALTYKGALSAIKIDRGPTGTILLA